MAKAPKKIKVKEPGIRLDTYGIFRRAVEEGVRYGYNRAFKYTESPGEAVITEQIENAVMNSLCEVITDFGNHE